MIQTKRLIIRHAKPEDHIILCQIRNQEFVQKYNAMRPPTPEGLSKEIENNNKNMFVIELKDTHQVIGEISIKPDDLRYQIASITISYYLNENHAKKGYMYEALHSFINNLFDHGIELISARHFKGNDASCALLTKLGFLHEGTLREGVKGYQDIIYDDCIYSLMPNELK